VPEPSSSASRPRPTRLHYRRRRTVAAAALAGVVVAMASAVAGDHSPLGPLEIKLTAAEKARLPWRAVVTDGSAGVLDGRGLPAPGAQRAAIDHYRSIGLPIYCAGGRGPFAALTFDDGPSQFSGQVLDLLRGARAQSTFFLIGRQVPGQGETVRRQLAMGGVADHTWNHPMLTRLSRRDLDFELGQTRRVLEQATRQPIDLFRAPYGDHNPAVDARVRGFGLLEILWSVDTRDSAGADPLSIAQNAEEGLQPGSIILMHETYQRSVAALPQILTAARRRGIRLVSVSQLLALDPPPDAQVRAGPLACGDRERYRRAEDATGMRLSRGRS
jgi:peptidoglycan-N-acetylglucosamine deacetylase